LGCEVAWLDLWEPWVGGDVLVVFYDCLVLVEVMHWKGTDSLSSMAACAAFLNWSASILAILDVILNVLD
jgi:hypothetical protein